MSEEDKKETDTVSKDDNRDNGVLYIGMDLPLTPRSSILRP